MRRVVVEHGVAPSSVSNCLSQMVSFAACAPAMYSALVLESTMEDCFLELQLTAPLARVKMKPEVDFQSFMSLAQSASTYPMSVEPLGLPR
jgi:hypothetical protein